MAELDLPAVPAELFEAVRAPIARHLGGERHMRLGGGTALAARWAHRDSMDVDLFVDSETYGRFFRSRAQFSDDLERASAGVKLHGIGPGYTIIHLEHGVVTLLSTHPLTDRPISRDTVRGTRVALESNAEILAKKLTHRLSVNDFVARDLYDVAVARHLDPEAVDIALAAMDRPALDEIRRHLGLLGPHWAADRGKSLLHPAHPRDATDSVAIVRRLIGRHLDGRE